MNRPIVFSLVLASVVAFACGGGGSSAATDTPSKLGAACTSTADCGSPGLRCGFLKSEACSARGVCVEGSDPPCAADHACACDGTTIQVNCGLPRGYERKPLLPEGQCASDGGVADGGTSDSGTSDGGAPCVVDTDCGSPGLRCGFLEQEACAAKGVCVPGSSPPCAFVAACACSGMTVGLSCGLPAGYQSEPLLHRGACSADGGTD